MSNSAGEAQGVQRVDLAQVSLPRLMFALLRQRFTGTVVVQQPPPHIGNRTLWFRGGMPVFTDWVAPEHVLGQVLVTAGSITEDQLLRALESMAVHGGLLGQHLTAHGVLDRSRLVEGLRLQCTRKLLAPFSLRAGEAHVTVSDTRELEADLRPVNVLAIILAGVGAAFDEPRVVHELGPVLRAPLQATASLTKYRAHFPFRPTDEPIVEALLQGCRLQQLVMLQGVTPLRAAQVIYTLWACQMLRATGTIEAPAPPSPSPSVPAPSIVPPSRPPPPPPPASRPEADDPVRRQTLTEIEIPATLAAPRVRQSTMLDDSNAEAEGEPTVDDNAFLDELAALEQKIAERAHPFALFDLPTTATKRDIRAAWGDLSRKFHPDALKGQGRTYLRARVNDVFAALSEAQQTLASPEKRDALAESIDKGDYQVAPDGKDATAQAHAVFQSELLAKEADKLLRANRFARALDRYREAAAYNADEPDIMAAIAWCEYQVSGKGPDDALRAHDQLLRILEDSPRIARAHYFLGFVLIDQNDLPAAIESFTKAGRLDSRLIDAERQARALKMKLGRSTGGASQRDKGGRRGGLKGLFGGRK